MIEFLLVVVIVAIVYPGLVRFVVEWTIGLILLSIAGLLAYLTIGVPTAFDWGILVGSVVAFLLFWLVQDRWDNRRRVKGVKNV